MFDAVSLVLGNMHLTKAATPDGVSWLHVDSSCLRRRRPLGFVGRNLS